MYRESGTALREGVAQVRIACNVLAVSLYEMDVFVKFEPEFH
jgi:hypothetical protein